MEDPENAFEKGGGFYRPQNASGFVSLNAGVDSYDAYVHTLMCDLVRKLDALNMPTGSSGRNLAVVVWPDNAIKAAIRQLRAKPYASMPRAAISRHRGKR